MGRSAVKTRSIHNKTCWRINETDTQVQLACSEYGYIVNLTKTRIKTPYEMFTTTSNVPRTRQFCNGGCSAPPRFSSANNTILPEVGYGRPFRWEMARVIAGDLRLLLCGKEEMDCAHLNASEWTLTNFLHHYFHSPEKLVVEHDKVVRNLTMTLEEILDDRDQNQPSLIQDDFEKKMWEDVPWVTCVNNNNNCTGTISKQDWLQDRGGQCSTKILEFLQQNPGIWQKFFPGIFFF